MSIASEITRIKTNIDNAYTALEAKGATIPSEKNSANLADTVATVTGGGGDFIHVGDLIKPQAKDIQHHRLELLEIGFHQGLELKVQAHLILDDAVDKACGQRRVPPGKLRSMELFHGVLLSWCGISNGLCVPCLP